MGKEQFREADTTRKVVGVKFTAGSSELIRQAAHLQIFSNRLYEDVQGKWQPAPFGPLDTRLGTFQQAIMCSTCGLKLDNCVGHFGFIDLEYPVFHVGFFRLVIQTLQCICKACSRTLLQGEQKEALLRQALTPNLDYLRKKALHKRMLALSKKCTLCAHCGLLNGVVKKAVGAILKIAHAEPIGPETVTDFVNAQQRGSGAEGERQREVGQLMGSAKYNLLDPLKVLDIFRKIDAKDIPFLMIGSDECKHPVNFLTQRIPVPPVCIRPSVVSVLKSGSNEDDLTMKLTEIMLINDILKKHKRDGAPMKTVAETWDHLQIQCALYINSELSGLPPEMQPKKFLRSFAQRLKGKEGRFRGNLSGKRVDFSGRTVISPDPNLKIDQVGVPRHIATTLTFPEVVCRANIELMRQLVRNGDSVHPGANLYIDKTGFKRFLRFGNREKIARDLQIGDIVERHLNDDDVVLFNRQPSLHKISIMAHRVKVMPYRTFRFNECACTPYNADFDGDEMNLHLPQTYEAKAEASLLMGLKSNLVSPRAGQPLIAAIQDFITSGYLLTHKDTFLPRSEVQRIASAVVEANNGATMGQRRIHLPPPAMLKPRELWTGKQLIELLIAPFQGTEVRLNLATKNRMHNPDEGEFTQNDTFVIIRNNQLLCGALDKALLGSESKCSIFYRLLRDWGEQHAIDAMWRLARISSIYLSNRGFSIGIGDVKPNANLLKEKSVLLSQGYKICDQLNKSMRLERQKDKPDLGVVEQLESKILKELSSIRDQAGKACKQYLSRKNAPLTMAQCGSKGSFINIAQMIALVGQQSISGKRPSDGFEMRSLPHFERNDRAPDAKGFVENSFFSGLTPTEFFFHTMGGREGLVDTAVKTAETGYMQRRLVKCLEDLAVNYDNTVRTSTNEVVQFTFGDDGLDPAYMEGKDGRPLDLPHVLAQVRNNSSSSSSSAMAGVSRKSDNTGGADVYEFGSLAELEDAIRAEIVHRMEVVVAGEGISTEWVEATARKKQQQQQQNCGEETRAVQQQQCHQQQPRITAQFGDELMKFFSDQFTRNLRILHTSPSQCQRHTGLMSPTTRSGGQSSRCKDCEPIAARRRALLHSGGFSIGQLRQFLDICAARVCRGTVEPGTAVGAIAATSIGEPSTQMTLKTFHFAGVASMNITQGVPRIKEIINAVRSISTPIITVALADEKDEKLARRVKARIERTTLGDICDYVEQVFLPDDLFVLVKLNTRRIRALQLEVTMDSIIGSICTAKLPVPRIMFDQVRSVGKSMLLVRPVGSPKCSITMYMHYLKYYLPSVVVKGLAGINRCVINADEKRGDSFQLFVEGTNFKEVLALTEINGVRTKFNNPLVIAEVLGIESARGAIISEILTTMGEHGIELDRRHVQLLADLMTYRGQVLGITRDGLVKMKESVLLLASFERTIDHLYEAAFFGQQDRISGVSECIIMGTPMGIGTGMFKLLQNQKPIRVRPIDRISVKEEPSVTRKQVKPVQHHHTSLREIKREITGDDELQQQQHQQQQQQQHVEEVSAPPPIPLQRQPIFELDELDIVI
uniref:DNA-directed RNA polymerase subunit n=1 Tax=Globodera rostochiensis TaxID=31243 RepID=A0A914IDK2_GLORO